MPATIPTKEHGGSKNPRSAMRKDEFSQLVAIQRRLEKRLKTIEFNDEQLNEVSIVQGSPFDIDQDDPIDVDPRYFLPGPVESMEYGLEVLRTTLDYWGDRPEHDFISHRKHPEYHESWPSPDDGRLCWQNWSSDAYYMWPRPPGNYRFKRGAPQYNPDVPHAVGTVNDMARPLRQGLLRSELLTAVSLLKAQIRWPRMYIDHHVCPVLVVSFHARFSARVLQAYFQNGKIVIRPSRLINLHTRTISPEVRLVIRWLNSRPVGDTHLPLGVLEKFDEEAASPVEVSDKQEVLSLTIQAR
ncbi:hypothetical protein QQZ08_007420 [Neonectria magnoliae]|uniref:Uncharacterized protein n=1 Tax=Neonectria magnoliae TaxID=2732573 RepID=A0ABR1HZ82_9HYPO